MKNIKLEISLNDIVEDMFVDCEIDYDMGARPTKSFSEEVRNEIVSSVSRQIASDIKGKALDDAKNKAKEIAENFVSGELQGILTRKLRAGELRAGYNGFKSYDVLIEDRIKRFDIDGLIKKHIDIKTKDFADEMRVRYDNVFAAKVVQGLNNQKMLDPNIAKLLLGDAN